jgi:hypothetical protein
MQCDTAVCAGSAPEWRQCGAATGGSAALARDPTPPPPLSPSWHALGLHSQWQWQWQCVSMCEPVQHAVAVVAPSEAAMRAWQSLRTSQTVSQQQLINDEEKYM